MILFSTTSNKRPRCLAWREHNAINKRPRDQPFIDYLTKAFFQSFSRFKEMKMNAIIKEVALYVFFVACLCIVSYSHRDPKSFAFRKTMYDTFVDGVYGGKKSFSAVSFSVNVNEVLITSLA